MSPMLSAELAGPSSPVTAVGASSFYRSLYVECSKPCIGNTVYEPLAN
jgi:hypothetical protein